MLTEILCERRQGCRIFKEQMRSSPRLWFGPEFLAEALFLPGGRRRSHNSPRRPSASLRPAGIVARSGRTRCRRSGKAFAKEGDHLINGHAGRLAGCIDEFGREHAVRWLAATGITGTVGQGAADKTLA